MMPAKTAELNCSEDRVVYMSLELSAKTWELFFGVGLGAKPRRRRVKAGDLCALSEEVGRAQEHFDLPSSSRVVSCYEAGRDGFWLHRYLDESGIENRVVDAGSMDRKVRRRRVKTDRIDGEKLLRLLMRSEQDGEKVWSVVRVPSVEAEDARQLHREREVLQREIRVHRNRIVGLLITQGVRLRIDRRFPERLREVRLWDSSPLPQALEARLLREWDRLTGVTAQLRGLEAERRRLLRESKAQAVEQVRQLMRLCGIGIQGGWVLPMELYAWRRFRNRRQIGGLVGLTPTPHQSGTSQRELGIDKAGIARVRTLAVELAWCWLRYQPDSELARWYERRFGHGGSRSRRIGIVALARKLLVALWRYLEEGIVPAGARLKTKPIY